MAARNSSSFIPKSSRSTILRVKNGAPQQVNQLTALSIMYQAERQDKASNVLAALALIAAALTYLGIAALLLSDIKLPGGPWTPAFVAFPLWVAASFHVLLIGSGMAISKSIRTVEQRLVSSLGFTGELRPALGAQAAEQVFNVYEQPAVLKIQSLICYGGVWSVIVFFSSVCLAVAAKTAGWTSVPVIAAGTVYTLLFAAAIAAWLHVLKLAKDAAVESCLD